VIKQLLAAKSIRKNIVLSGFKEYVNGGEVDGGEGEQSIFHGGERWQLKSIFCGLPYGSTLPGTRKRNANVSPQDIRSTLFTES